MGSAADLRLRIRAAREGFLATGATQESAVDDVVAASWQRSLRAGVDAATSQASFHSDLNVSSRLVRCSRPIIDRLREQTTDIPLSIAITDGKARVLTRVDTAPTIGRLLDNVSFAPGFDYAEGGMGTNGVGTVFESGQPIQIVGPEHFHERLQPFACSGSPIRDPISGRIDGALDISCLTEHSSPLMHSLVRSAAHDIERNLLIDRSQCQQALFETFIRTDARSHGAVMAIGGAVVMANTVAQGLLSPVEQATIQDHARYLMSRQNRAVDQLELTTGKVVRIKGARIVVGNDVAGMVIEIALVAEGAPPAPSQMLSEQPVPSLTMHRGTGLSLPLLLIPSTLSGSGHSPLWKRACKDIASASSTHEALLVMGETGTGKFSLLAEIYHQVNPGGRSLLIDAVDISAYFYDDAEAALEATTRPTLYIFRNIDELSTDGVDELNKFLLTLADSERPVYVAATLSDANIDSDLPFRDLLVHFQKAVTVPPLRARTEDIAAVVSQVLDKISHKRPTRVGPAAMRVICRYTWPRNITQLEEALASALLRRPVGDIQPEDLPGYCHDSARRQLSGMEAVERDAIVKALRDAEGNRVQAAATLGIARSSLYRKLKSFGISTI
jgi:sigma-54 dependent transcriptional regulator, acetoin dehydrogenase operon transcriptional activator AcoR